MDLRLLVSSNKPNILFHSETKNFSSHRIAPIISSLTFSSLIFYREGWRTSALLEFICYYYVISAKIKLIHALVTYGPQNTSGHFTKVYGLLKLWGEELSLKI